MWIWEVLIFIVELKSGESSDEDEEKMGVGNFIIVFLLIFVSFLILSNWWWLVF